MKTDFQKGDRVRIIDGSGSCGIYAEGTEFTILRPHSQSGSTDYVVFQELLAEYPQHNCDVKRLELIPQREPAPDLYSYVADKLGKSRSDAKRDLFMYAYGKPVPALADLKHDPQIEQLVADVNAKIMRTIHANAVVTGTLTTRLPHLQSIPKEQPVNKTAEQLRADLLEAEAYEALTAANAARAEKLFKYRELLAATDALLQKIGGPSIPTTPSKYLASHRSELKALAAEFGYRIVLVGDRTAAVLVQA